MSTTKKVELVTVDLDPKPGALASVFAAFREAKVEVDGCWAYQMGPDKGVAHIYARDVARAKDALTKLGKKPRSDFACYATGTDRLGVYHEHLKKISDAGLNLEASDAFAVDDKFAIMFWVDQKDVPKLCSALGC